MKDVQMCRCANMQICKYANMQMVHTKRKYQRKYDLILCKVANDIKI